MFNLSEFCNSFAHFYQKLYALHKNIPTKSGNNFGNLTFKSRNVSLFIFEEQFWKKKNRKKCKPVSPPKFD